MVLPVVHAVEVTTGREVSPPGLPALLYGQLARKGGCLVIGLEVPPLYRSSDGVLYPFVLRALSEQLAGALQRGFFEFTRVQRNSPFRRTFAGDCTNVPPTQTRCKGRIQGSGSDQLSARAEVVVTWGAGKPVAIAFSK